MNWLCSSHEEIENAGRGDQHSYRFEVSGDRVWLSHRCFTAKGQESIQLLAGLTHQIGCVNDSRPRRFRAMLDPGLTTILAV